MQAVRCPKCGKLLGYFDGKGTVMCPRCRRDTKVYFNTALKVVMLERNEENI